MMLLVNHDNPYDQEVYRRAAGAASHMFLLNLLLCMTKFVVGGLGGSFALVTDAINNLTDVALSIGLYVGMKLAGRPPDREHPYGHGKIEPEIARLVGLVILVTAGGILVGAISRLTDFHDPPHMAVLIVALISIVVKEGMYRYQRHMAQLLSSGALAADALNHRSDVAATASVLIGTLVVWVGGPRLAPADDVAAILVAVLMAFAASRVVIAASRELLDEMPSEEILLHVRSAAQQVSGVLGVEKVLGRKMGLRYVLDLHLEVAPQLRVDEAHALGHQVKNEIMRRVPEVADVLVHIEPSPHTF